MKLRALFLIAALSSLLSVHAQKLTVEAMKPAPMDLSASQYERKDLAGKPCALVKVQLAAYGAQFEGNVISPVEYKTGEYWVYMSDGSYMLSVKHPNYLPLSVNFRDYGISGVVGKTTYIMTIPALQSVSGSLNVNYQPTNAEVWIDGRKAGSSPDIFRNLKVGSHEVELRASGYHTKKETVSIQAGQTAMLTGSLEPQAVAQKPSVTQNMAQPVANSTSNSHIETFTVKGVSFNMVRVEGGTFRMGSDDRDSYSDEKPVHQVTVSSYSIGETEVTQELWQAVMGSNLSMFKGSKRPVEMVSWEDCQEFISKLNQMSGRKFRLPTEAEWEYAARGGNRSRGYKYAGSNTIDNVALYCDNSGGSTHNVKTKQANKLGLYDMSGNVWEWCQDWYVSYGNNSQTNPTGPDSGNSRVARGGGWNDRARLCCVSNRLRSGPTSRYDNLGLRLAL